MKVKRTPKEAAWASVSFTQIWIVIGSVVLAHNPYKKHGVWPFLIYAAVILAISFGSYAFFSLRKKYHNTRPW